MTADLKPKSTAAAINPDTVAKTFVYLKNRALQAINSGRVRYERPYTYSSIMNRRFRISVSIEQLPKSDRDSRQMTLLDLVDS